MTGIVLDELKCHSGKNVPKGSIMEQPENDYAK